MAAQRVFVAGLGFIDHGQLGGQFAVLAVLQIPLKGDRYADRDHVGVSRAALGVAGLDAPVGSFVGLRQPGIGFRGIDFCAHGQQIRVLLGVSSFSVQ
jgi:hypothetical protein